MGGNKNPDTRTDRRGDQRGKYPLDPVLMARVCRAYAADLRAEAAKGWPDIALTNAAADGYQRTTISRAEAAVRMDAQAARWEDEAADGPLNVIDREKIGF